MLSISIVVDNVAKKSMLKSTWGFSTFIEHDNLRGFFDVGPSISILEKNANLLNIDLSSPIDFVFISHMHGDHVGALLDFVKKYKPKSLYLPDDVSEKALRKYSSLVDYVRVVQEPTQLTSSLFSTGTLRYSVPEESLLIKEGHVTLMIVGCSHPKVERIVSFARGTFGTTIDLVIGGFHISGFENGVRTGRALKELSVEYAIPCHCTGTQAKEGLYTVYRKRIICGVGLTLRVLNNRIKVE
mgnify:CR=1 FL=1